MSHRRRVSRREFLEQAAIAAGALALGPGALSAQRPTMPRPSQSGIDRSFDHLMAPSSPRARRRNPSGVIASHRGGRTE
jgi:hypothetical protein